MSMMDLFTREQAIEALEGAEATKVEFMIEVDNINNLIFILKYYLETGDALDPAAFGIDDPTDDEGDLDD